MYYVRTSFQFFMARICSRHTGLLIRRETTAQKNEFWVKNRTGHKFPVLSRIFSMLEIWVGKKTKYGDNLMLAAVSRKKAVQR